MFSPGGAKTNNPKSRGSLSSFVPNNFYFLSSQKQNLSQHKGTGIQLFRFSNPEPFFPFPLNSIFLRKNRVIVFLSEFNTLSRRTKRGVRVCIICHASALWYPAPSSPSLAFVTSIAYYSLSLSLLRD